MSRRIKAGETDPDLRRVYFHLVDVDGVAPATGEAGGQPQVSIDGTDWADEGIGTLTHVGHGRCFAVLDEASAAAPAVIETRYKSASTAECEGDTLIVSDDPYGEAVADALAALRGAT